MKATNTTLKSGAAIAATVAAMFAAGAVMVPAVANAAEEVQCFGSNSCKGHGSCKTAKNDCSGMNACKDRAGNPRPPRKSAKAAGGHVMMKGK